MENSYILSASCTSIIVPKGQMLAIKFNKNELLAAIDRASLFTNSDNLSIVKLVLTTDKIVKVSSNSTEMGRVEDEIYPLEVSEAMDFQIAFSTRNLSEALKSFESQSILMKFTGEVKPAVIVGEKENDLIQLLLPVRVF